MSGIRIAEDVGYAKNNEKNLIQRIDQDGPTSLTVQNLGEAAVVFSAEKHSDDSNIAMSGDTAVAAENTGYTGNDSTLAFTGQALNNTAIVPGTVEIIPTTGSNTVDAYDTDGDGILYTDDDDAEECGTINYHTGALVLAYPTGKAPNTGTISANYNYQTATVADAGQQVMTIPAQSVGERINVYAAGYGAGSKVRVVSVII